MIIVKSTQTEQPKNIEVNKDTVYVRSNVKRIQENGFEGWEYEEEQYTLQEYMETLTPTFDTDSLAMLVVNLMSEVDYLSSRIEVLEGN